LAYFAQPQAQAQAQAQPQRIKFKIDKAELNLKFAKFEAANVKGLPVHQAKLYYIIDMIGAFLHIPGESKSSYSH